MASKEKTFWRKLERVLFGVTLWIVVALSLGGIATKFKMGKPSSVPAHYLLALAVVGAVIALIAPKIEEYILVRISKVHIGGLELQLISETGNDLDLLKYDETTSSIDSFSPHLPKDRPFPVEKLTGAGLYQYEKLSHRLYRIFDQVDDLAELSYKRRENYRKLIKWIGRAAYAMGHHTKYRDILSRLEAFSDLTDDELLVIGDSYLWAAYELPEDSPRRIDYWRRSVPFLEAARKKNPDQPRIPFNLGHALIRLARCDDDNVGHYEKCIELMEESIKLRPALKPWAYWYTACAQKRMRKDQDALNSLGKIDSGPVWDEIEVDEWFKDPDENTPFRKAFNDLVQVRKPRNP